MKIDCHIHITPPDIIRDYKKIGAKEPYFHLLSSAPHNRFATYEQVAAQLTEHDFDKGVIFGFGFEDMGLCRYVNDYTIEAVRNYPDRFIGFMVLPPAHKDAAKEMLRCHEKGLRGIGELFPEGQKIDLTTLHKSEFSACLKHLNLPLMLHANETVGHSYAGKTKTSPEELETFIENHPEQTILLAHFGGGLLFYELMKEIKKAHQNVYYDTAAGIYLYDKAIYKVAEAIGILDKVLFGTDFPLLPISRYYDSLSDLSNENRQAVLGKNAVRMFEKLGISL